MYLSSGNRTAGRPAPTSNLVSLVTHGSKLQITRHLVSTLFASYFPIDTRFKTHISIYDAYMEIVVLLNFSIYLHLC